MAKRWLARVREQKSVVLQRSLIGVLSMAAVVGSWYLLPIIFPGGWGIGKDQSATTESVESVSKDAQGNITKTVKTTKYDDGKTFWDWLSLLGVPLSLAILGYLLQQNQQKRAEKVAKEQRERDERIAKEQREIAAGETKEEILQGYFDRLSILLVDKNLLAIASKVYASETQENEGQQKIEATLEERELLDSAVDVIRARTLSILRRFENDSERKTSVIRFLIEADIVSKLKLNLSGANLSSAGLMEADLSKADLSGADLSESNLIGANLSEAILNRAKLNNAHLLYADLRESELIGADLRGARLSSADLRGANLSRAKLNGAELIATRLSQANLSQTRFGNNQVLSVDAISEMKERGAIFEDLPESDVPSFVKR
jgi:Pentapeptide repeats (8 copies)